MIRLVMQDAEGAVDLFQKDHPHQLMRKSQVGEGKLHVRSFQDLIRQAQRSADHKENMAVSAYGEGSDFF